MKKTVILFSLICLLGCFGSFPSKAADKKASNIIEAQSFWVTLDSWGKVRFVSRERSINGEKQVHFSLMNQSGTVIYNFPDFYGNLWTFYEIKAVSIKDANQDGLKDVIVIVDCKDGAVPFPVCSAYFQTGKKFVNLLQLDDGINNANQNKDINTVMKYIASHLGEVTGWLKNKN